MWIFLDFFSGALDYHMIVHVIISRWARDCFPAAQATAPWQCTLNYKLQW